MTDNAPITDTSAAPQGTLPGMAPAAPTTTPATPATTDARFTGTWYEKYDPVDQEYIAKKGWQAPEHLFKSYRNLEKLHSGSKTVVEIPDYTNPDQVGKFYDSLGRPQKSDEYKLNIAKDANPEVIKWFKDTVHKNGLNQRQAESVFNSWNEYTSGLQRQHQEQQQALLQEELTDLKREFGAAHDATIQKSELSMMNLFQVDKSHLEWIKERVGPAVFYLMGQAISNKMGSDNFVDGSSSSSNFGEMTPAAAQNEINMLKMDKNFMNVLTRERGPGHDEAVKKWSRLNAYAAGNKPN